MTFEVIEPKEIPQRVKAFQENIAIYQAARKLAMLGVGRAMRVTVDNVSLERVRKKAYVHFRHRNHKLRTKKVDGYLYMWIEERQPKRFEVTGVPASKTLAARA